MRLIAAGSHTATHAPNHNDSSIPLHQRGAESNFDYILPIATSYAALISLLSVLAFIKIKVLVKVRVARSTMFVGQLSRILRTAKARAMTAALQARNGIGCSFSSRCTSASAVIDQSHHP